MTGGIENLIPGFILRDKNGYALAKAIEAGLNAMTAAIEEGTQIVLNPDVMPEWRLDEMAWEMGGLYDYKATEDEKRIWIKEAVPLYASYGTAAAIEKYLKGYFEEAEVEESVQYGGSPFHFRITVRGDLNDEKMRIAQKAAEELKNVRSIMDDISIGKIAGIAMRLDADYFAVNLSSVPNASDTLYAGTWPNSTIL